MTERWDDDDVAALARSLIVRVRGRAAGRVLLEVDVDGTRYQLTQAAPAAEAVSGLSPREQEIARMVALGHPNKVIASVLQISSWTVNTHLRRVFVKLGVASRAAMVARIAERDAAATEDAPRVPRASAGVQP